MRVPMTVRFSSQLVAELVQPSWAAWQAGEFMTDASAVAGTYRNRGLAWVRQAGGVRPRRGRGLRQPNRQGAQRKSRVRPDRINIAARPAEADDRAVPGHWEGDLVIGKANATAIGTLVERTTGYTMLVHLLDGYKPAQVAPVLAAKIQTLPEALRGSLTWDQGVEMRDWKQVRMATDMAIYFCDPHAPWQRGTNENTNGLLSQYFPKGTDLSVHSAADLDVAAARLNTRPRKTLEYAKPIEEIGPL